MSPPPPQKSILSDPRADLVAATQSDIEEGVLALDLTSSQEERGEKSKQTAPATPEAAEDIVMDESLMQLLQEELLNDLLTTTSSQPEPEGDLQARQEQNKARAADNDDDGLRLQNLPQEDLELLQEFFPGVQRNATPAPTTTMTPTRPQKGACRFETESQDNLEDSPPFVTPSYILRRRQQILG
jgi:hypothetical protein